MIQRVEIIGYRVESVVIRHEEDEFRPCSGGDPPVLIQPKYRQLRVFGGRNLE